MANADSKPECGTSKETHHYTVGYLPNGGRKQPAPAINLKGRWLEKAGFTTGTLIEVTVIDNCLVIKQVKRVSLMNERW